MITWFVIVALIVGILTGAVVMYFVARRKKNAGTDMTLQEVLSWLEVHNFIAMARNQVEGLDTTPPLEGSEWAQVLVPCSEEDCPRQIPDPAHCPDLVEVNGKKYCQGLINLINPTEPVRKIPEPDPKMLTDEEIQMMTTLIERIKDANIKS